MFTAPISPVRLCRRAFLTVGVSLLASSAAVASSPIPVRVGSISAADLNLAHAVKETLITDLAKSDHLTLLAGSKVPGAARAAYTLTGSCLFVGPNVIINLRMVNASGHTVPGAAENVMGPRSELFRLIHTLAGKFTARLTGGVNHAATRRASPSRQLETAPIRVEPKILYKEPEETAPAADESDEPAERYTSVIIDARGLGLERSMCPKIRRPDGSTVYDGGDCTPDFAIEKGVVGYATSVEKARCMDRAGSRPLVIVAQDRHDQPLSSDPIITDDDADYLAKCAKRNGFFKKYNVIFLIDK